MAEEFPEAAPNDQELLTALRNLGEVGHLNSAIRRTLRGLEDSGINCQSRDYWNNVCSTLSQDELYHLFKGLVIAERDLKISGGSVSATSKVFERISDSLPLQDAYSLAVWAAETSQNTYTPICSINARSILYFYREHILKSGLLTFSEAYASALSIVKSQRSAEWKLRVEEFQARAEERQSQRVAANEQKNSRRDDRSKERLAQIEAASKLAVHERLHWLATTNLPLPAIPTDLLDIKLLNDIQVPHETRQLLLKKLQDQKGYWKKLRSFLA